MKKKRLLFLLACFSLLSCDNDEDYKIIDILEINDLHGYVDKLSKSNKNLSNISYTINENRKNYDTVVIANGDMFEGTAFSNLSNGLSTINVLNTLNLDMMGIGNHEFSWGLDSILNYFDGSTLNGEANFPLVNCNVYSSSTSIDELSDNDLILPYKIIERNGVKIGMLSYIGDVSGSINAKYLEKYHFDEKNFEKNFKANISKKSLQLKELGADIIVVNIHGGDSNNIKDYNLNKVCASVVDESGNYLIDAVINGHTHSIQKDYITRDDGVKLPLVQGGSYGNYIGKIRLKLDGETNKVVKSDVSIIEPSSNEDNTTKAIIEEEYNKIKPILEKKYATTVYNYSKEQIGNLFSNELLVATKTDVAFINTGGIRMNLSKGDITYAKIYEIYPFENKIELYEISGSDLNKFLSLESDYYYFAGLKTFDDNKIYTVATLDYVSNSTYFKNIMTSRKFISNFDYTLRDLFINDLTNRGKDSFNIKDSIVINL